ncbi:MAG: fibronectin type III domain-containing protein [Acidimicrobiales bacterium]
MSESRGIANVVPGFVRAARRVTVLSAVAAVLSFNLLSITTAGADPYWTNAIEIPGLSTINQFAASPGPIVCTSSGNCVSGGAFTDGNQADQAFLADETNGVWSSATEVGAALNVGGLGQIVAISCPSAGNCTAEGNYTDLASAVHTFVINQVNGTWGFPTEVPDFTTLAYQDASQMLVLSCSSTTTCVGLGTYVNHVAGVAQPIIYTETNGVWANPVEVQGAGTFNTNGLALPGGLDCTSVGNCVAGGDVVVVTSTGATVVPWLVNQTNGVWGAIEAIPGVAALSREDAASLTGLSCGADGDCVAAGDYLNASGNSQAYVASEQGGVWESATQLFATQLLGSGLSNTLNGLACPSAGNCTAVGSYADAKGNTQPFVVDDVNHTWDTASEIPGVQTLNSSAGSTLTNVACSAVGACSAGGTYVDADNKTQAFLINESSGTWSAPIEVPGTATLNKGGAAQIDGVSCSADGSCGVQGAYTDSGQNTQLFVVNSSVVAPTTIASAPRHVTAVDKKGVVTVRWTAPASDGGAAITKYSVVSLPAAKTCTTTSTSCTFKGLNKKIHYSFEVRATNKDGLSPLSARSNSVEAK